MALDDMKDFIKPATRGHDNDTIAIDPVATSTKYRLPNVKRQSTCTGYAEGSLQGVQQFFTGRQNAPVQPARRPVDVIVPALQTTPKRNALGQYS